MHNIYLKTLSLVNYRNFLNIEIKVSNVPIILIGENGSGKTNILEAISLFSPGRGLRSAKLDNICKRGEEHCFVNSLLHSKLGPVELSIHLSSNKRIIKFNDIKIQNNELSQFSSMIWLTPQMDSIFSLGLSDRRKFFDRIVYNFNPSHATIISKFEYYMYERSKILTQDQIDENWIKIIEQKIAELSVEITNNRLETSYNMQQAINDLDSEFPKALISVDGIIETKMSTDNNKTNIINFITNELSATRIKDKLSGRTNFGVHKSDFIVIHKKKNILAKLCSTGEQKAMLISIILAQINHAIKTKIAIPILLLDEVFVHLDNRRKQYLIDFFIESKSQLWTTATDLNGIETLAQKSELIKLD